MGRTSQAAIWTCGLALLLAGCGGPGEPSIVGHWQAEQLRVNSLLLPIGPDLIISERTLEVPATDTRLEVTGMERNGPEVTLQFRAGLGWTFRLEGSQRMAIDVPMLGVVHYRRVAPGAPHARSAHTVAPAATSAMAAAQAPAPSARLQASLPAATPPAARASAAAAQPGDVTLDEARAALQAGDTDLALRKLDLALLTRRVTPTAVRDDPQWAPIREDIRYQALMARDRRGAQDGGE